MKQPMVKVRQMANMYDIKIGVRGGGAGTPPPGSTPHPGGALLILQLLAFPFLRQSTVYNIALHCTHPVAN